MARLGKFRSAGTGSSRASPMSLNGYHSRLLSGFCSTRLMANDTPESTTPPERNMIARRRWFRYWALKSPASLCICRARQGSTCGPDGIGGDIAHRDVAALGDRLARQRATHARAATGEGSDLSGKILHERRRSFPFQSSNGSRLASFPARRETASKLEVRKFRVLTVNTSRTAGIRLGSWPLWMMISDTATMRPAGLDPLANPFGPKVLPMSSV